MDITSAHAQRHSEKDFARKFSTYVDSGAGIIHVRTNEIIRATVAIRKQVIIDGGTVREWDIVNGFRHFTKDNVSDILVAGDGNIDIGSAFASPLDTLRTPANQEGVMYYVFVAPHVFMENNPTMNQLLLTYSHALPSSNVVVVLVTPDLPLPTEAESNILSIHFEPPGLGELTESLAGIIDGVAADFDEGVPLTEEDIERVCYVGAGMSKNHFETYAALAIVEAARDGKDTVTRDEIIAGVSIGKTDIVNSNDILELYPSTDIANVGGLENLKEWVAKRRGCYSDAAKEFGIEPPKGVVLVGPPGCAYGGTEIKYRRGVRNSGRTLTLEALYCKFNGLPYAADGTGNSTPWHDMSLPTYIQSLSPDGEIFYNRVISVIQSGKKEVIRITVDSGESIQLTANHPVALPGGVFAPTESLCVGQKVLMQGTMLPEGGDGRRIDARPPRKVVYGIKYHPSVTKQARYARLAIEAHMNSMPVDEFIHALKHNETLSSSFRYLPAEYEVHHVDENTLNDSLDNLMVISTVEHARLHGKYENFKVNYVREATIVSLEHLPARMTYDVQMDMPANNFVAEGFIVHNTGKSLIAKAISSELGVPLVRLDFGRVFNSLVGASEQRMRTALKMVENMSPCCTEDTMVELADGTKETLAQLYRHQNGTGVMVRSLDPETGKRVDVPLNAVLRKEGKGKGLLRIRTASGKAVSVTMAHKLLIRYPEGLRWVEARNLSVGDDLVEVDDEEGILSGASVR